MKLKLTTREKTSLVVEGIVTIILLAMLNLAVLVILQSILRSNPGITVGLFVIKQSLIFGPGPLRTSAYSWSWVLVALLFIIDLIVLVWRLRRRYRLFQMNHVISELHYIANGHLDHRIPFHLHGQSQEVVTSINALVDSTVNSIAEERKVEQSKNELITNVSHDLRTPLTNIIGYLGLVEDHQYHSEADIVNYCHIAYEKAKQMKDLVEDLFEYTRVQSGAPIKFMRLDLSQMLEQVTASFELEAEKKHVAINSTTVPSPLMIDADPEQLGRVFSNLVSNAMKYGNGASYVNLDARQRGSKVVVKVANDGTPIPKASLPHLFERFYRVEGSRSKATGGTGLGLAIVKSIVDLHHGSVKVTSNTKETAFTVTLPLHQPRTKKDQSTRQK